MNRDRLGKNVYETIGIEQLKMKTKNRKQHLNRKENNWV